MRRAFVIASVLLAMAACAGRTPPAARSAMVPATAASGYGYSETKLAPDSCEVTYVTPALGLPPEGEGRAKALEAEKRRAYDMALWRAAQLALAGGFPWLNLAPSRRDAEVKLTTLYRPAAPNVYGPGGMIYPQWIYNPQVSYFGAPGVGPYWAYDDPFAQGPDVTASAKITARLKVSFARTATPSSLDAKATEQRMVAAYGAAAY